VEEPRIPFRKKEMVGEGGTIECTPKTSKEKKKLDKKNRGVVKGGRRNVWDIGESKTAFGTSGGYKKLVWGAVKSRKVRKRGDSHKSMSRTRKTLKREKNREQNRSGTRNRNWEETCSMKIKQN